MITSKIIASLATTAVAGASLLGGAAATAATATTAHRGHPGLPRVKPAVIGTVTAVNGTSLSVTDHSQTVYTVDDSQANITKGFGKDATTMTTADVKTGDMVAVQGTVSGTNVTATSIVDGVPAKDGHDPHGGPGMGQRPGAFGTVSAVNGSSFTVTEPVGPPNADSSAVTTKTVTVTTDSNTTYSKDRVAGTSADVVVGTHVMVVGTLDSNTNTVTATKVDVMTKVPDFKSGTNGKKPFTSKGDTDDATTAPATNG